MKTLVTVPTAETKARLRAIFLSAPLSIDMDQLYVPLAYVPDTPVGGFISGEKYAGRFTAYRVMFDETRNQAELVGILESEGMKVRSKQLGMPEGFLHKCIFLPYSPAQSMVVRNFNVSVADTLVLRESAFTFEREFLL